MKIIFFTLLILNITACSHSYKAWRKYEPSEYLEVYVNDMLEQDLVKKGIDYNCVELEYSSEGYTKKCYVKKTAAEQLHDWQVRLYKTSIAASLDGAIIFLVIGYLILQSPGVDDDIR